jgi:hypothetical protein
MKGALVCSAPILSSFSSVFRYFQRQQSAIVAAALSLLVIGGKPKNRSIVASTS